jgi:hypothetical protein
MQRGKYLIFKLDVAASMIFTPFIREGTENQKKWEQKFYAQAEALRNS